MSSAVFRPDIQGLRAVAIVSVLVFHAFGNILTGGFVGVDIFFVISGFLITQIIIRDIGNSAFSIANFYRRRIRRIFPALALMLIFCLIVGFLIDSLWRYRDLGKFTVAASVFASNIAFWKSSGYFDTASELKPLLHTWSLAVEEQFYIVYPVLMIAIARYGKRFTAAILVALSIGSLLASELLIRASSTAAFYLPTSRGFELLIGGIVAVGVLPQARTPRVQGVLSLAGLALITYSLAIFSPQASFPGLSALVPCIGTAMVIHAGMGTQSPGGRLISSPVFLSLGDISYSLYLWHWPILVYGRQLVGRELSVPETFAAVGLALMAAYASYYFVERRFIQKPLQTFPFLRLGMATVIAFTAIGLTIFVSNGVPLRFEPKALKMFAYARDFNNRRDECHNEAPPLREFSRNCTFGSKSSPPDVAVWGDSHGTELVVALGERAAEVNRSVMQITSSSCPPAQNFLLPERPWCPDQNRTTLDALTRDPNIRTVVLATNALRYASSPELMAGFEQTVTSLSAANKHVVVVLQIPVMPLSPPDAIGMAVQKQRDPNVIGISRERAEAQGARWNDFLLSLSHKYAITVVDPKLALCDDAICRTYDERAGVLYFNDDHISVSGARLVSSALANSLYARAGEQE